MNSICYIVGKYRKSADGIGRYSKTLIEGVRGSAFFNEINIVPDNLDIFSKQKSKNLSLYLPNTVKNKIDLANLEFNYLKRFYYNVVTLKKELASVNADLYHAVSPSETVSALLLNKRPLITTVHDIIPILYTNRFFLEKSYFRLYINSAKKSDGIICDSENTKDDLIRILRFPKQKIFVVYPGIDDKFIYRERKRLNNKKELLYVGGLTKRKGIYQALLAFENLLKIRSDLHFTIVGSGEEFSNIEKRYKKQIEEKLITLCGYVDEASLIKIYQFADVFIYPSFYEGFGFSPLEAMAAGVPVVTSNTSSLVEIVGTAAISIDPNDFMEIAKAINKILMSPFLQKNLSSKGILCAKSFSWKRSVTSTLNVYSKYL